MCVHVSAGNSYTGPVQASASGIGLRHPLERDCCESELSKSFAAEAAFVGLIMWSHAAACPEEMCYRGWCTHTASSQIANHFALTLCIARVSRELPSFLFAA